MFTFNYRYMGFNMIDDFILYMIIICIGCFLVAMFYN